MLCVMCDVACDFVCDVVCDAGVSGGVKGLILCCLGVLVTDRQTNEWTETANQNGRVGHQITVGSVSSSLHWWS